MNSGTIREITTNACWMSYGVLHFPRDNKIKGVAVSVCSRQSDSRRSLNFKYCISAGRDIHVNVDVLVSKLEIGRDSGFQCKDGTTLIRNLEIAGN